MTISFVNLFKKRGQMNDTIFTGLLGGFLGTIIMDLSNYLIFKAGKTEALYGHIAGGLWVAPYRTKQKKNFLIGEFTHFGIGSLWGVLTSYLLKKTGKDHHLIKGLFVSTLSLRALMSGQNLGWLKKFRLTKTIYSAIWNHVVYGLASSQFIVWYLNPTRHNSSQNRLKTCSNVQNETAEMRAINQY